MDFAETEMLLGKPANSMAIAPLDIRKARMRISATGISFGEAPKAVVVRAMGIEARGKGKGEGARCGTPPRKVNYSATSDGVGAGGSEGAGATGLSPVPVSFFRPPFLLAAFTPGPRPRNGTRLNSASFSLSFP
jgi:hypothetical protein